MNDEEIKKIAENYFSPFICAAETSQDGDTDYGNLIKLSIMDNNKKKIEEFKIARNELSIGQEIDRQKFLSFLNLIKEYIKKRGSN
jgi:hypothetical protein